MKNIAFKMALKTAWCLVTGAWGKLMLRCNISTDIGAVRSSSLVLLGDCIQKWEKGGKA